MFSARSNDSAYVRSQAVAEAYTILDAIRANRQAALAGSYAIGSISAYSYSGPDCAAAGANCSASTLAQYDLSQWKNWVQVAVGPSGDGAVTMASVANPTTGLIDVTATVTVRWDDTVARQSFGATGQYASVVLESILRARIGGFSLVELMVALTLGLLVTGAVISVFVGSRSAYQATSGLVERYWNALLENDGKPQACGWITDKYGLRWQIVATVLGDMLTDPDRTKAKREAEEMLKQVKFDIAKLVAAFRGS